MNVNPQIVLSFESFSTFWTLSVSVLDPMYVLYVNLQIVLSFAVGTGS